MSFSTDAQLVRGEEQTDPGPRCNVTLYNRLFVIRRVTYRRMPGPQEKQRGAGWIAEVWQGLHVCFYARGLYRPAGNIRQTQLHPGAR